MKVLITGIGDAYTTKSYGSSALLEGPGGFVQLDCPEPIHRVLKEATDAAGWKVDVTNIHDIILTHIHGDHSSGLEMFAFKRFVLRATNPDLPRTRLHLTQPVADRLWEKLAPSMDGAHTGQPRTIDDFFDLRIMDTDSVADICGLRVRCRYTGHPVPTIGLLISDGERALGWSGDTPFEQAHIDWLAEAEVIVHESNRGAPHTAIESLNALPDELRARMRLIHLPDDFDPSVTDIRPLRQGEIIDL